MRSSIDRGSRFDLGRAIKKWALSSFVIASFFAYVIDERLNQANPASTASSAPTVQGGANQSQSQPQQALPADPAQAAQPVQPTAVPPVAVAQGQYKDGTYTGIVADAFYGNLQVAAIIQGGKLADVQVLQYPNDRRTSQEINSQALPWLKQEAVQVQNANVDFISGATLTSNAFAESLQSALQNARS
jgi:uncharacterized protein with FMN-binding domain